MADHNTRRSPSPSMFGYTLSRRGVVKGAVGAAALGLGLPRRLASAKVELGKASGELTVGSNYTDTVPTKEGLRAALDAFPNKNVTIKVNETDHNTFQEN